MRNQGCYEVFKYHFWGYSRYPSNPKEDLSWRQTQTSDTQGQSMDAISTLQYRPLQPRYLCFLKEGSGIQIRKVDEWIETHGIGADIRYIFVAYTAEQFDQSTKEDMNELHRIAEVAARAAGVSAYWIGCSCMSENRDELSDDIYRISDVVRGADSLVIAIGPPTSDIGSNHTVEAMLKHWGNRGWTFPEVLLAPKKRISIYTRDTDLHHPIEQEKRNFASLAWEDAVVSRQLVDHYEGSLILSPLELISIALKCLQGRDIGNYSPGDLSYILMGLLRRRPVVCTDDSEFQAFCRLSLANDSKQLIERFICMLPSDIHGDFYKIDDFWDRNLWDIEPLCQVVGVGGDDTITLSGAFGSPIRWKSFASVNLLLRRTLKRNVSRVLLRGLPIWSIVGIAMLAGDHSEGGPFAPLTALGWIIIIFSIIIFILSPRLLRSLYVGKTWAAQPWLFGFEGYLDIGEIETKIFGINIGRLKWSPYSSNLSRHQEIENECIGVDPTGDLNIKSLVTRAPNSGYGEPKIFTLVDTNTMTVTLIQAARPPVALVLCGSEGGMLRALLCSYDWKRQTLCRETVVRIDTIVLSKMSRIDRFRLALNRKLDETYESVRANVQSENVFHKLFP